MKHGNRRCEHLLREAELWSATAAVRGLLDYPARRARAAWETVLLHQFHDILPGSSIAWVHREARATYARGRRPTSRRSSSGRWTRSPGTGDEPVAFNAAPLARLGVPALGAGPPATSGWPRPRSATQDGRARCSRATVSASTVDRHGVIRSVLDLRHDREVLPPGGRGQPAGAAPRPPATLGRLGPRRALPHARSPPLTDVDERRRRRRRGRGATVVRRLVGRAADHPARRAGSRSTPRSTGTSGRRCSSSPSTATCTPTRRATRRSSGTSSGRRTSTPAGTPPASRSARTAGRWSARRGTASRSPTHDVRPRRDPAPAARAAAPTHASGRRLLRAPRFPDPDTDQGRHSFRHAIVPGAGVAEAAEAGYALNLPAPTASRSRGRAAGRRRDGTAYVEAVKLAEDGSGDLVVRLYEPLGAPRPGAGHGVVRDVWCGGRRPPRAPAGERRVGRSRRSRCGRSRSSLCVGSGERRLHIRRIPTTSSGRPRATSSAEVAVARAVVPVLRDEVPEARAEVVVRRLNGPRSRGQCGG